MSPNAMKLRNGHRSPVWTYGGFQSTLPAMEMFKYGLATWDVFHTRSSYIGATTIPLAVGKSVIVDSVRISAQSSLIPKAILSMTFNSQETSSKRAFRRDMAIHCF